MNKRRIMEIIYGTDMLQAYSIGELIFISCLVGISISIIIFIIIDSINEKF